MTAASAVACLVHAVCAPFEVLQVVFEPLQIELELGFAGCAEDMLVVGCFPACRACGLRQVLAPWLRFGCVWSCCLNPLFATVGRLVQYSVCVRLALAVRLPLTWLVRGRCGGLRFGVRASCPRAVGGLSRPRRSRDPRSGGPVSVGSLVFLLQVFVVQHDEHDHRVCSVKEREYRYGYRVRVGGDLYDDDCEHRYRVDHVGRFLDYVHDFLHVFAHSFTAFRAISSISRASLR